MNKTKIDDMLIEMINPKIKEIEKKFGTEQILTQEDINTLLLKSQYNHINHLDMKLDEVTINVESLKDNFKELKDDFKELKNDFKELQYNVNNKIEKLELSFEKLELSLDNKIEKALNRNLKQTFFAIGGFFILVKGFEYLDLFIKPTTTP
jgi:predicted  nucleic acid-binding Zn-ribbon protein